MDRVLVTGASGLIGSALVRALVDDGVVVRAAFRTAPVQPLHGAETVVVGELGSDQDWSRALDGVSAVVHLAGPAHAKHDAAHYQQAIVAGAGQLARQASRAGVRRFVFISSIKAAVTRTAEKPVPEGDLPAPIDAYGRAKLAAEREIVEQLGARAVVLRPPLVCAANARANFKRLLELADSPFPLPFAGLRNKRSLIGLPSLIAVIRTVLTAQDPAPGVFHVADRPALSTGEIIAALRRGLGRSANQFAVPGIGALLPAPLAESLAVNDGAIRAAYGLSPSVDARDMLAATAAAWKAAR